MHPEMCEGHRFFSKTVHAILCISWCKNYELQNALIRCDISMESAVFTKTPTFFNTKQLFYVQLNQDRTYLKQY